MKRHDIEAEWSAAAVRLGLATERASHGLACVLFGEHTGQQLALTERPWGVSGSATVEIPAAVSFVACDHDFLVACRRSDVAQVAEQAMNRVSALTGGPTAHPAWRAFFLPHLLVPQPMNPSEQSRQILLLHGSLPSHGLGERLVTLPPCFILGCWDKNIRLDVRAAHRDLGPEQAWRMLVDLVERIAETGDNA